MRFDLFLNHGSDTDVPGFRLSWQPDHNSGWVTHNLAPEDVVHIIEAFRCCNLNVLAGRLENDANAAFAHARELIATRQDQALQLIERLRDAERNYQP